jgi:hypothetical protein
MTSGKCGRQRDSNFHETRWRLKTKHNKIARLRRCKHEFFTWIALFSTTTQFSQFGDAAAFSPKRAEKRILLPENGFLAAKEKKRRAR